MWNEIETHPFIQDIKKELSVSSSLLFEQLWDSPKALITLIASKYLKKNVLILTEGERQSHLMDDLSYFSSLPLFNFPSWETLPGEKIAPSPDIIGKRFEILANLSTEKRPSITLTSLQALLQKMMPPASLNKLILTLEKGQSFSFTTLPETLSLLGYKRETIAADKGEFAIRGGILDIFPISSYHPFRLDFFDDEIEDIRIYDPISQKSIDKAKKILILPAKEQQLLEEKDPKELVCLMHYLGENPLIIFDDLLALEDKWVYLKDLPGAKSSLFFTLAEIFEKIKKCKKIYFIKEALDSFVQGTHLQSPLSSSPKKVTFNVFDQMLEAKQLSHPFDSLHTLFGHPDSEKIELQKMKEKSAIFKIHFLTDSKTEEKTLTEKLSLLSWKKGTYQISKGYLSNGFVLGKLVMVPFTEFTKRYKIHREKWRNTYHTPPSEFHHMEKGDLVVHFHNGIGKFIGIEKQKNHLGHFEEFLILEYANQSKLFVPLTQSHLINRYIGSDQKSPTLNTLGTKKWQKAKASVQKSIVGYAHDLLHLQATREAQGGFKFPPDSKEMLLFEHEFPFTETEDQLESIAAFKKDMESKKAMDRLVCGDVGYGKTEVAMRAAFKATVDGNKQVAILVPTTVLAMQHFETFIARMENFPIKIGVLSRFIKSKEIKKTLQEAAEGTLDILIGTHRIISKDVKFKNLGLIIIDEEQRFGVRAKEHLKKLKIGVDCLTLSATPIPRTLYFSLIGARDMSVINTPPHDRLPIKTILAEKEDELIKNALTRELARNGQAYVIHNRVESIYKIKDHIVKLIPQAAIGVVHGQMEAFQIDALFHAFKAGEIDILIATTIIENGIDIPNANTILIDRADTYGLADLYQLRGRVGRWNRSAYAYLLTKKSRALSEPSQKRLQALVETSGFGGGMKLAMRDLEIRGAGDLLGVKQSGNVSTIGFHFYCKQLKRAIHALKKHKTPSLFETRMEFPYDATLPSSYIPETHLRMEIYHRLGEVSSPEEVQTLFNELKDRFGALPPQVIWLYHLTRIRVFAMQHQFSLLKFGRSSLTVERETKKGLDKKTSFLPPIKTPEELEQKVLQLLTLGFELS